MSRHVSLTLATAVLVGGLLAAQGPQPAAGGPGARGGARGGGRGGTPIQPGEECPPGMTEWRTDNCRAPEFPSPSILDYRPASTLVVATHEVPKAKYGVV